MLLEVGKYNKISEAYLPKLPEPGTTETFMFLEKAKDPIANKGLPIDGYPVSKSIPVTSRVRCEDGKWYDIGLVKGWDDKEKCLIPFDWSHYNFSPSRLGGLLTITIGHSADEDALWQYLMLAPFVEGNKCPNPDTKTKKLLRYVDYEADARIARERREQRREAMKIANGLDDAQVIELAYILRLDPKSDMEILRNEIEDYADKEPATFLARIKDPTAQYKARFAQALQLNIVAYNPDTQFVYWNDTARGEIFKVINALPDNMQAEYADFVQNNAGGSRIDEALQTQIRTKMTGVKPGRKKVA